MSISYPSPPTQRPQVEATRQIPVKSLRSDEVKIASGLQSQQSEAGKAIRYDIKFFLRRTIFVFAGHHIFVTVRQPHRIGPENRPIHGVEQEIGRSLMIFKEPKIKFQRPMTYPPCGAMVALFLRFEGRLRSRLDRHNTRPERRQPPRQAACARPSPWPWQSPRPLSYRGWKPRSLNRPSG